MQLLISQCDSVHHNTAGRCSLSWWSGRGLLEVYWGWTDAASAGDLEEICYQAVSSSTLMTACMIQMSPTSMQSRKQSAVSNWRQWQRGYETVGKPHEGWKKECYNPQTDQLIISYMCSAQYRNLCNLNNVLRILWIWKLCAFLEIERHQCAILRSSNFCCMHNWTRSSFEFPLCIKVRNICQELLQLCCHHQHWACTQASQSRNFWEIRQLRETLFLLVGRREIPDLWSALFKASPTRRTCNSLPLVSSDTLTPLVCYINELCWHNPEIAQMFCTTSRLACSFWIFRLCSMISRWCKFLDCMEHM